MRRSTAAWASTSRKHRRVEQRPDVGVVEHQQPLDDQERPWLDRFRRRPAGVRGEVVDGTLDRLATLQRAQVRDEPIPVERLGRVEVPPLTRRPVQVAEVVVVGIHREDGGVDQRLGQRMGEGGLARPGRAGDADQMGCAPSRHGATLPLVDALGVRYQIAQAELYQRLLHPGVFEALPHIAG